ncbi:MAG TPA: ATP-binding protein [Edaphobacter sp.]|nr:ATP-binding protein [Edaphobacter sp.]
MQSQRYLTTSRWIIALACLLAIVAAYRAWIHVNPTTVALTLLLYILLVAARMGLRYAVVISLVATACYNLFFLPPVGTFTISDPQNWLALFAFLATSVTGSRLSQQARDEAEHAQTRKREVELLFVLSRELLQTDNVAQIVSQVPEMILHVTGSSSVLLFLLDGDKVYQAGLQSGTEIELPNLRQLALGLSDVDPGTGTFVQIPLREGARPRGLLLVSDVQLSQDSYRALGSLVSIALDRAQAIENVSKVNAARESERLRTLILDSITHELRTPLTAIKGAASSLLNNEEVNSENRHELLSIIDEEADRLNRLVGQAVEMAQLEAQEVHMVFAAVPLRDIVEAARNSCSWVFTTHPVTVHLDTVPDVNVDAGMILKVLCNLLENAAKYSKPESPIFISAEEKNGLIYTSVADRGIGIDSAEQTLIFDRLYRSPHHSGETTGTGMGLAISRAIVQSHGGTLTVTSQPDHGSVFTFSLPIAERASRNGT